MTSQISKSLIASLLLWLTASTVYADASQIQRTQIQRTNADSLPAQAILVDVRSQQEWNRGHVAGALHLPVNTIEDAAGRNLSDQSAPIVTYCAQGPRAVRAARILKKLGYQQARALTGGYQDLKAAGLPVNE